MKEPQLKTRFEAAAEELRDREENKVLRKHLGAIRDAVCELQDEGMRLSLEVRPGASGFTLPLDPDSKPAANGTIRINSTEISFVFLRSGLSMRFRAYVGVENIGNVYLYREDDLKATALDIIVKAGAQAQMVEEFNLSESGARGMATVKDFTVAAPLSLKRLQKP